MEKNKKLEKKVNKIKRKVGKECDLIDNTFFCLFDCWLVVFVFTTATGILI